MIQRRESIACSLSGLLGLYIATKYVTPHAGFKLSIGAGFYFLGQFFYDFVEYKRIAKEKETGIRTFDRL